MIFVFISLIFNIFFVYVYYLIRVFIYFYKKIKKYNISASSIYSFNKKGFLISLLRSIKRVISINVLKCKRIIRVS
jgi:hypothetical protein